MESSKFEVGQEDRLCGPLSSVDEVLGDLSAGYGDSRIVLMPRDPQWAYTYWDVPNEHKEELRRQGGQQLALRVYDVTDIDLSSQSPHSVQEYLCDELAREWYMPIPVSDRDYAVDIGYRCGDGRWLILAHSTPVRIPPVYPSDWIEDIFITVDWEADLRGKTAYQLAIPSQGQEAVSSPIYDEIFARAQGIEAQRVAGSLFGSMQQVPGSIPPPISSYIFPSGVGMWSGVGMMMSGIGISGAGFSASMPPLRPRQFWLVANAELIVYGATEADATVTIGGRPIRLEPDGTFRFQMAFPDGSIDFPILAVAADGEQTRSIHMKFTRETLDWRANVKEEAGRKDLKQIRIPEGWESIEEIKNQVLQEYEKLERLKHLEKDKWALAGFYEEELMELQQDYENFINQEEVFNLLSPIIEDFQRQAREGKPPTGSDMADLVIPTLLEAAADGIILIPQNPKLQEMLAKVIESFQNALKTLEQEQEDLKKKKNNIPKEGFGLEETHSAGDQRFVPPV